MIARAATGAVVALLIALAARRWGTLSGGGAAAAVVAGTASAAAGLGWAALLILFFVSSSLLSRFGVEIKEARTASIVEKGSARDATQVAANGGLFTVFAILSLLWPWSGWLAAGAGSLAAAAADTWGTEVGTLADAEPRHILTMRRVPAGTSGAVSWAGLVATVGGSALIATGALLVGWPEVVARAAFLGGLAGALADTLAGALVQSRRRCPKCESLTERAVHSCGAPTVHEGGVRWMDNDAVNLLAATTGAVVTLIVVL